MLKEEAQLPTSGHQVNPSASKLPLWGSENPRVILMEGAVPIHSHKTIKVCYLQIPEPGERGGSKRAGGRTAHYPRSPASRIEALFTYNVVGAEITNFSTLSGYLKWCPWEEQRGNLKQESVLSSGPYLSVQTLSVNRVVIL